VMKPDGYLRCYPSKWNMSHINREGISGSCHIIIKPSADKFAMSLYSSISRPERDESVTKSNGPSGTEVRHPLSAEKELGNQTYPSRYEANPWP
jgi:hypothetical protein